MAIISLNLISTELGGRHLLTQDGERLDAGVHHVRAGSAEQQAGGSRCCVGCVLTVDESGEGESQVLLPTPEVRLLQVLMSASLKKRKATGSIGRLIRRGPVIDLLIGMSMRRAGTMNLRFT